MGNLKISFTNVHIRYENITRYPSGSTCGALHRLHCNPATERAGIGPISTVQYTASALLDDSLPVHLSQGACEYLYVLIGVIQLLQ